MSEQAKKDSTGNWTKDMLFHFLSIFLLPSLVLEFSGTLVGSSGLCCISRVLVPVRISWNDDEGHGPLWVANDRACVETVVRAPTSLEFQSLFKKNNIAANTDCPLQGSHAYGQFGILSSRAGSEGTMVRGLNCLHDCSTKTKTINYLCWRHWRFFRYEDLYAFFWKCKEVMILKKWYVEMRPPWTL